MSYAKARYEARRGVSDEKREQIYRVLDKSKNLKYRISQTREELSSEVSIKFDYESRKASVDRNDYQAGPQTAVFYPILQYANQQNQPLYRDSFVLQTAKMQLDYLEAQLYATKYRKSSAGKKKDANQSKAGSENYPNIAGKYRIITSAMPETESEDDFYVSESVCAFVQAIYFMSVYEGCSCYFSLRFVAEVSGIAYYFYLFDLTDKSEFVQTNNCSPYVLSFLVNRPIVLPYLENSSLTIKCLGKIGDAQIQAVYELPYFMKGAYAMKFADQSYLVLRSTELLYDNYFQTEIFYDTMFSLVINYRRVENCIVDYSALERHKILPLKVELFAFACGYRAYSLQLSATHDSLIYGMKKIQFSSRVITSNQVTYRAAENKATQFSGVEEVRAEEQRNRLVEVQENIFFDDATYEYFVKMPAAAQAESVSRPKPLSFCQEEKYIRSLREPTEFITSLVIQQLELCCLGDIAKSIDALEVSQNNKTQLVASEVPIADGHALITRVTLYLPQLERQIAPLYFKVFVSSNLEQNQLSGSCTLEYLATLAISEKWIDLQPFGRLKVRISALPPLCGQHAYFLDTAYQVIDVNYSVYKTHAPQYFLQNNVYTVADTLHSAFPPYPLVLRQAGEMPDFKSELESIISRLEDCSANVSVGHEIASEVVYQQQYSLQAARGVPNDLYAAHDLIEAVKAAQTPQTEEPRQQVCVDQVADTKPQKIAYKCSESILDADISSKVQEMIKEAQLSPVLKNASAAAAVLRQPYQNNSDSEETSDVDQQERHSSWARRQARKIFGGDLSDDE